MRGGEERERGPGGNSLQYGHGHGHGHGQWSRSRSVVTVSGHGLGLKQGSGTHRGARKTERKEGCCASCVLQREVGEGGWPGFESDICVLRKPNIKKVMIICVNNPDRHKAIGPIRNAYDRITLLLF